MEGSPEDVGSATKRARMEAASNKLHAHIQVDADVMIRIPDKGTVWMWLFSCWDLMTFWLHHVWIT